jgi:hypothetical protein
MLVPALPSSAVAQAYASRVFTFPDVTFEQGFTGVIAVHELPDGRVIVVDRLERSITLLRADGTVVGQLGRTGSGPGEYLMPGTALAVEGDTLLVLDTGNGRFLVIGPDATLDDVRNLHGKPVGGPPPSTTLPPARASDRMGRFYARGQAAARTAEGTLVLIDSAAIERWAPASAKRDTVAYIPVSHPAGTSTRGGMVGHLARDTPPFPVDARWAVSFDGWITIAYPEPYRVDLVDPRGVRRTGTPVRYERIPVTEAHKKQWCTERERPAPWLVTRLRGEGAGRSTVQMISRPCEPPAQWPEYLPPFLEDAIAFAPDGRLWIQRTAHIGQTGTVDVFDRNARLVEQIRLPNGSRVIGFGKESVYVLQHDELDLQHIARYRLTSPPGS